MEQGGGVSSIAENKEGGARRKGVRVSEQNIHYDNFSLAKEAFSLII